VETVSSHCDLMLNSQQHGDWLQRVEIYFFVKEVKLKTNDGDGNITRSIR
jgi:hypothetical protein